MDHNSKTTLDGAVNLPDLPQEIVHRILLFALLLDHPTSRCDALSKYRREIQPDYVLPHQGEPWGSKPVQPYSHSRVLNGSFTRGYVKLKDALESIRESDIFTFGTADYYWRTHPLSFKSEGHVISEALHYDPTDSLA
jgi:hypothetical protein